MKPSGHVEHTEHSLFRTPSHFWDKNRPGPQEADAQLEHCVLLVALQDLEMYRPEPHDVAHPLHTVFIVPVHPPLAYDPDGHDEHDEHMLLRTPSQDCDRNWPTPQLDEPQMEHVASFVGVQPDEMY
jgi:hypothetical protein